ncbi:hypothetical protein [Azospirillum sp. ST 5-10]|uniref:hypothetical protein n=1 Tax=unclassified Azospirillum TaxID=2630922 RepID=UPI003F49E67F
MAKLIPTVAAAFALAVPCAAAAPAETLQAWSAEVPSGRVEATVERSGNRDALVVTVRPERGVRIQPSVLRIDAPMLMRSRLKGKFPTTVRDAGKGGVMRATLPVTQRGGVRFGTPDSNDGALRVEYRYCPQERPTCSVERIDIALRMGN